MDKIHLHIVQPYDSFAMKRVVAPLLNDERFKDIFLVTTSGEPANADITYHVPWHTLVGYEGKGRQVMFYTHCNPGAENQLMDAVSRADLVICMAFAGRQELIELGADPKKMYVIHGGFSHVPMRRKNIGVICTEQPNGRKRTFLLLDLVWKMKREVLNALHFVLVGSNLGTVAQMMNAAGASVMHVESVTDEQLKDIYYGLDYLLVTGYIEGGPFPLLEAMSAGVPVISPNIGYARDFLEWFVYNDLDDLIETLEGITHWSRGDASLASALSDDRYVDEHTAVFASLMNADVEIKTGELRYRQIYQIIEENKVGSIVEIGTWNGNHALQMIQTAACSHPMNEIEYQGFDLFEEQTGEQFVREFSKRAWPERVVSRLLNASGANISLVRGDTRETLRNLRRNADLYFIDGGHSVETILNDWEMVEAAMGGNSIVIFDDYYRGNTPEGVGCNSVIRALSREQYLVTFLPVETRTEDGRIINMVEVRRRGNVHISMSSQTQTGSSAPNEHFTTYSLPKVQGNDAQGSPDCDGELERTSSAS